MGFHDLCLAHRANPTVSTRMKLAGRAQALTLGVVAALRAALRLSLIERLLHLRPEKRCTNCAQVIERDEVKDKAKDKGLVRRRAAAN